MSEAIHCLVFSKDRPMQLDAFLRSARLYSPYASVTVCAVDGPGYRQCFIENGQTQWWFERPSFTLEEQVRFFLYDRKRVVFHTDDELFYRTPPAFLLAGADDVVPTFRQGLNTTCCQVLDVEQALPETWPCWRWKDAEHDFGYPLSLNACVYWSRDILPLLDFSFANPTQLEAGLAARADRFGPQKMAAHDHSCTVALPHNVVSVDSGCPRGGNLAWQPRALLEKYLEGWRIDLDAMDFTNIVAAHQEVPLKFRKVR